jgi:hypothetical protein
MMAPPKNGPLEQCPNYRVCQTYVAANKRGQEHRYGVYDREKDEIVYKTCNGG